MPHFRRDALDAVGGWDPYNVTEDADLGLRLTRFGYRIGMITRPTHEAAPADYETWLPQRTRWFKGWMRLNALFCNILNMNKICKSSRFIVVVTATK
ncbi:glycosyltransferase [Aliihoeflea sp. 40Bstr573]|nr:glycosyltransferase [Aliihoeflea sp. 40Bstr573]